MKRTNKFSLLFTFLCITFLFFSCQQEACYSCDDSIDTWVKQSKELVNSFDRSDLVKLNHEKQIASFRFYSKEKRKDLWIDKFSVLKKSLTNQEKAYFKFIDVFIEQIDFENGITSADEKKFFKWFNTGRERFKWDDEFLIKAFVSLNNVDDFNYRAAESEEEKDCVCRWDTACDISGLGDCDDSIECEDTVLGCGLLFLQSCNGRCSG